MASRTFSLLPQDGEDHGTAMNHIGPPIYGSTVPKEFVKAVNLGNRFHFGNFSANLDLMGRFSEMEAPFSGFTVAFAPSYEISDWGRIFAKGVWEDDNLIYGAGFEYFPLKENKDIRLHAAWAYNEYMYGNTLNIGLTWKMNMTRGIKRIFGATED